MSLVIDVLPLLVQAVLQRVLLDSLPVFSLSLQLFRMLIDKVWVTLKLNVLAWIMTGRRVRLLLLMMGNRTMRGIPRGRRRRVMLLLLLRHPHHSISSLSQHCHWKQTDR
jgi:hypothetical protein